jgi:T6SS, Transcription factor, DNA binding domain
MRQPPLDPDAAHEAPVAGMLTPYDHEHLVTYLRLLDAEVDRADWKEAARAILHIDPDREPARARLPWESHVRRVHWMTKEGYRHLLRLSQLH